MARYKGHQKLMYSDYCCNCRLNCSTAPSAHFILCLELVNRDTASMQKQAKALSISLCVRRIACLSVSNLPHTFRSIVGIVVVWCIGESERRIGQLHQRWLCCVHRLGSQDLAIRSRLPSLTCEVMLRIKLLWQQLGRQFTSSLRDKLQLDWVDS